jgi:diacylglycerol kinase (ATP)
VTAPELGRVGLLVNPTAGKGRGASAGQAAGAHLRAAGVDVTELVGRDGEEALDLARAAVAGGVDTLVAVGGDGIVHLAVQAVATTATALGVVAAGSGNDIARALGLPPAHDPHAAVRALLASPPRVLDAGRVGDHFFAGVLSSGFDSAVNSRANRMSWPQGPMRYNVAIVAELGVFRAQPFTVTVDGVAHPIEAMLVAVGNGSTYGGGMRICPAASMDDGQLDVTVLGRISKPAFVRVFPSVYKGTHIHHPAVQVFRGRRIELAAPGVEAYADGEFVAPLPVVVEVAPGALRVRAPGPAAPAG